MTDLPYTLDYQALLQTRKTLHDALSAMDKQAWNANGARAVYLARCAEICRQADMALFNVLNALEAYMDDETAGQHVGMTTVAQGVEDLPNLFESDAELDRFLAFAHGLTAS